MTSKSAFDEPTRRRCVCGLPQERLLVRRAPTQRVEADAVPIKVNLATNEPAGPAGMDVEPSTQEGGGSSIGGAAQEDHHAAQGRVEIGVPRARKRTPRDHLDARRAALTACLQIRVGPQPEVDVRQVPEATPAPG
jgi:hypothetical protein